MCGKERRSLFYTAYPGSCACISKTVTGFHNIGRKVPIRQRAFVVFMIGLPRITFSSRTHYYNTHPFPCNNIWLNNKDITKITLTFA